MWELQKIGNKFLELILGSIHSQSFAEVASLLAMASTGQLFRVSRSWLKSKRISRELSRAKWSRESRTDLFLTPIKEATTPWVATRLETTTLQEWSWDSKIKMFKSSELKTMLSYTIKTTVKTRREI